MSTIIPREPDKEDFIFRLIRLIKSLETPPSIIYYPLVIIFFSLWWGILRLTGDMSAESAMSVITLPLFFAIFIKAINR